jgi:hypothetical protein
VIVVKRGLVSARSDGSALRWPDRSENGRGATGETNESGQPEQSGGNRAGGRCLGFINGEKTMHVATGKQIERLVSNGDEQVSMACYDAALAVNDIMDKWGSMQDWQVQMAVRDLRHLISTITGEES